jgi:hypothetical protein
MKNIQMKITLNNGVELDILWELIINRPKGHNMIKKWRKNLTQFTILIII